ncbi:LAMI_0F10286g1_1 [Lachancea mirantina]|uniref:Obg-like ATPase homolog n=1 Tax=Lachancea mirantina TaxID=1230905 RepID=A0A1G4K1Z7_9SACH|nr:LAMI_0F10286g1_1 [Lachancea mirantina]
MVIRFIARLYSTQGLRPGRPSNNLTAGIVGLANVGKSTFFQAITNSKLGNPANYPFATIEPAEARVVVPSAELDHLANLYGSGKRIPAVLTIFDIAGLTRGASRGDGLGNKFLNDIRHVDGIYQVVRGFDGQEITHIEGSVDPTRDLSIVQDELILKDLEFLEGVREKVEKMSKRTPRTSIEYKDHLFEIEFLNRLEEHMYEGRKIWNFKDNTWTENEVAVLNKHNFLTAKPTVILLNVGVQDYVHKENRHLQEVRDWVEEYSPGSQLLLFSAEFETIYNAQNVAQPFQSAMSEIILEMRKSLGLISFFTCGPLEARQWTIREGSLAPEAAGVIHTDLEKTFISADITKYTDLAELSPPLQESQLKSQAKVKRAGKNYLMQDKDVVFFKAAASSKR